MAFAPPKLSLGPTASSTPIFGAPTPATIFGAAATPPTSIFGAPAAPTTTFSAGAAPTTTFGAPAAPSTTTNIFSTAAATPSTTTTAPATTPASTGFTLGGGTGSLTTTASSSSTTTTSQPALQSMSFADFNGILARLTDEYEDLNRQFVEDVAFLNDFDKVLRDNHSKIAAANEELSEIENDTAKCANESECISAQLKDIANLVTVLEKELNINELDDTLATDASKNSDMKRQHIMQMYLSTEAQMIQLEDDVDGLSQQVDAIVKITGPDQANASETFDDIRQILGNQMDQLIYVDKQSEELNKRLNDIKVKL